MFASFFGWLLGQAMNLAGSGVVGKAIDWLGKQANGAARLEEIRTTAAAELEGRAIEARTARQAQKMNWPVFWIIICVMMGPPALILWGVAVYNILWWQHGIWPQGWAIADFPPSIKPWVEKSIDWLYDPIGAPGTIGTAGLLGWLTGRGR